MITFRGGGEATRILRVALVIAATSQRHAWRDKRSWFQLMVSRGESLEKELEGDAPLGELN